MACLKSAFDQSADALKMELDTFFRSVYLRCLSGINYSSFADHAAIGELRLVLLDAPLACLLQHHIHASVTAS